MLSSVTWPESPHLFSSFQSFQELLLRDSSLEKVLRAWCKIGCWLALRTVDIISPIGSSVPSTHQYDCSTLRYYPGPFAADSECLGSLGAVSSLQRSCLIS